MVNTLASFGLAYVLVKFCVGVLGETKHVGLVLVKDRRSWMKTWLYCTLMALITCSLLIVIGNGVFKNSMIEHKIFLRINLEIHIIISIVKSICESSWRNMSYKICLL